MERERIKRQIIQNRYLIPRRGRLTSINRCARSSHLTAICLKKSDDGQYAPAAGQNAAKEQAMGTIKLPAEQQREMGAEAKAGKKASVKPAAKKSAQAILRAGSAW